MCVFVSGTLSALGPASLLRWLGFPEGSGGLHTYTSAPPVDKQVRALELGGGAFPMQ